MAGWGVCWGTPTAVFDRNHYGKEEQWRPQPWWWEQRGDWLKRMEKQEENKTKNKQNDKEKTASYYNQAVVILHDISG